MYSIIKKSNALLLSCFMFISGCQQQSGGASSGAPVQSSSSTAEIASPASDKPSSDSNPLANAAATVASEATGSGEPNAGNETSSNEPQSPVVDPVIPSVAPPPTPTKPTTESSTFSSDPMGGLTDSQLDLLNNFTLSFPNSDPSQPPPTPLNFYEAVLRNFDGINSGFYNQENHTYPPVTFCQVKETACSFDSLYSAIGLKIKQSKNENFPMLEKTSGADDISKYKLALDDILSHNAEGLDHLVAWLFDSTSSNSHEIERLPGISTPIINDYSAPPLLTPYTQLLNENKDSLVSDFNNTAINLETYDKLNLILEKIKNVTVPYPLIAEQVTNLKKMIEILLTLNREKAQQSDLISSVPSADAGGQLSDNNNPGGSDQSTNPNPDTTVISNENGVDQNANQPTPVPQPEEPTILAQFVVEPVKEALVWIQETIVEPTLNALTVAVETTVDTLSLAVSSFLNLFIASPNVIPEASPNYTAVNNFLSNLSKSSAKFENVCSFKATIKNTTDQTSIAPSFKAYDSFSLIANFNLGVKFSSNSTATYSLEEASGFKVERDGLLAKLNENTINSIMGSGNFFDLNKILYEISPTVTNSIVPSWVRFQRFYFYNMKGSNNVGFNMDFNKNSNFNWSSLRYVSNLELINQAITENNQGTYQIRNKNVHNNSDLFSLDSTPFSASGIMCQFNVSTLNYKINGLAPTELTELQNNYPSFISEGNLQVPDVTLVSTDELTATDNRIYSTDLFKKPSYFDELKALTNPNNQVLTQLPQAPVMAVAQGDSEPVSSQSLVSEQQAVAKVAQEKAAADAAAAKAAAEAAAKTAADAAAKAAADLLVAQTQLASYKTQAEGFKNQALASFTSAQASLDMSITSLTAANNSAKAARTSADDAAKMDTEKIATAKVTEANTAANQAQSVVTAAQTTLSVIQNAKTQAENSYKAALGAYNFIANYTLSSGSTISSDVAAKVTEASNAAKAAAAASTSASDKLVSIKSAAKSAADAATTAAAAKQAVFDAIQAAKILAENKSALEQVLSQAQASLTNGTMTLPNICSFEGIKFTNPGPDLEKVYNSWWNLFDYSMVDTRKYDRSGYTTNMGLFVDFNNRNSDGRPRIELLVDPSFVEKNNTLYAGDPGWASTKNFNNFLEFYFTDKNTYFDKPIVSKQTNIIGSIVDGTKYRDEINGLLSNNTSEQVYQVRNYNRLTGSQSMSNWFSSLKEFIYPFDASGVMCEFSIKLKKFSVNLPADTVSKLAANYGNLFKNNMIVVPYLNRTVTKTTLSPSAIPAFNVPAYQDGLDKLPSGLLTAQ